MNQLKTVLLLGILSALFIGIGGYFGQGTLLLFGGIAIAMNFAAYYWSDKIVLRMHNAQAVDREAAPALHNTIEELCHRAELPMPAVYIIDEDQPNAFATGRSPDHAAVAVTTGILQVLNERELRGVLAHELAHIKNRDILIASVAAMIASGIAFAGQALQWGAMFGLGRSNDDEDGGGSAIGAFLFAMIAPLAASLIQFGISRSREYQADATGAELCRDPNALADALVKLQYGAEHIPAHVQQPATASLFIVNPLMGGSRGRSLGQSMATLFSTHPATEERVTRLRQMAIA